MSTEPTYQARLSEARRERAAAIAADNSWLTLAGLYWLQAGENSFGSAENNAIVLPGAAAPSSAGSFRLEAGKVYLQPHTDVPLQVNGEPASCQELHHDMSGNVDLITLGALTMVVIKRGDRHGIRLFDNNSDRRQSFTDLAWFAIDPAYRIEATFVAYTPPKPITYGNVVGDQVSEDSPGYVTFTWAGQVCQLDALPRGDRLFFNFRDQTNGESTYGAGRFLSVDGPQEGTVILDFNRATNPYCAYTAYATCPLPPQQNRLPVRIEAGERTFVL